QAKRKHVVYVEGSDAPRLRHGLHGKGGCCGLRPPRDAAAKEVLSLCDEPAEGCTPTRADDNGELLDFCEECCLGVSKAKDNNGFRGCETHGVEQSQD